MATSGARGSWDNLKKRCEEKLAEVKRRVLHTSFGSQSSSSTSKGSSMFRCRGVGRRLGGVRSRFVRLWRRDSGRDGTWREVRGPGMAATILVCVVSWGTWAKNGEKYWTHGHKIRKWSNITRKNHKVTEQNLENLEKNSRKMAGKHERWNNWRKIWE